MARAALAAANDLASLVSTMSEDDQKTPRASLQAVKTALDKADRNNYKSSDDDPNEVSAKLYDVLHSLAPAKWRARRRMARSTREVAHVKALGEQLQEARSLPKKLATARRYFAGA